MPTANGVKFVPMQGFSPNPRDPLAGGLFFEDGILKLQNHGGGGGAAAFRINALTAQNVPTTVFEVQNDGDTVFNGNLLPDANDGGSLGTAALSWSDLFLASGAVINFNNGNVTVTHSTGLLTTNSGLIANNGGLGAGGVLNSAMVAAGTVAISYEASEDARIIAFGPNNTTLPTTFRIVLAEADGGGQIVPISISQAGVVTMGLGATFTGTVTITDVNVVLSATTGTKIGTATTQKLGFWNATPVVQGAAVADASGGGTVDAEARTALNTLLARMRTYGLIAT